MNFLAFEDWILISPLFHKVIRKFFNIEKYLWENFQKLVVNLKIFTHYIFKCPINFFLEIFFLQNNSIVHLLKKELWHRKFDVNFPKLQSLVKFILRKSSQFFLVKTRQNLWGKKKHCKSQSLIFKFEPRFKFLKFRSLWFIYTTMIVFPKCCVNVIYFNIKSIDHAHFEGPLDGELEQVTHSKTLKINSNGIASLLQLLGLFKIPTTC